jgi:hypothetical protein
MSSFSRKKTTEDFVKRISDEPARTVSNKLLAVRNFERFLKEKYDVSPEKFCEELLNLKQKNEDEFLDSLYDTLQNWIIWNIKRKLGIEDEF